GGRAEAARKMEGDAPELMLQTFVTPSRPIEDVLKTRTAKLRIRTAAEGGLPELPSTGAQRVEMDRDGRSATVVVDVARPLPASGEDAENSEWLEPSPLIDFETDQVRRLAQRAKERASEVASAAAQAESMRRLVYRHINRKGM